MKTRILTSIVGLAVLAVVLINFNTAVFDVAVALICLVAVHEAYKAFGFRKKDLYLYLPAIPFTLVVMFGHAGAARQAILPLSFCLALYYCLCVIKNHRTLSVEKLGGFLLFSAVIELCFYSLVELKRVLPAAEYHSDAVYFVLLVLCIAWGGDSAAYFTGRALGKHKLAPEVSPHKTVEGAVGGVLGSVILALALTDVYGDIANRVEAFTAGFIGPELYFLLAILAAFSSVLGILGDLFASAVKRQCGIKDYGTIFPGHGGILDRFDSVMFIAPFVTSCVTSVFYALRK